MPRSGVDLNADGRMDLVTSRDGKGIEVFLGEAGATFARRGVRQAFPSGGRIAFSDYDGDALQDFVLYDSQDPEAPVRVGRNLGRLPGTVVAGATATR